MANQILQEIKELGTSRYDPKAGSDTGQPKSDKFS